MHALDRVADQQRRRRTNRRHELTNRGGLEGAQIAPESEYTRIGPLSAVRDELMPQRLLSVAGFVLAGGLSRRMGRPKAALLLGDETMLARQVRLLKSVSRSVAVVGRPAGFERPDARGIGLA